MHYESKRSTARHRIAFFGELLMRLSPPRNELPLQSPRFDVHFGGAEANVAASLAILGHDSIMISALPDNVIGHACAGELRRHGVDTTALHDGASEEASCRRTAEQGSDTEAAGDRRAHV